MPRETRARKPVSYADSGSSTPAWMKSTKAFTKEPETRERKTTTKAPKVAPAASPRAKQEDGKTSNGKTPQKENSRPSGEDEARPMKRGRGRPPGTTKEAMAKRAGSGAGNKKSTTSSRKVSAMGKAAAIAKEGLKRPAKYFESNERSDSGRAKKSSKLASISSPGSDSDSPGFLRRVSTPGGKTPPRGRGRPPNNSKLGRAAAAATEAANRANGVLNANEQTAPQSTAWSGAYRMLQSAFEKLQAKYDKLKSTKMQDLMYEAERQQGALMDHERKAEELVHHLRTEADRQRDIASRAEGASEKAYELERENAELRETVLSYQGKMLRMEQELEDIRAGKVDDMRAGGSGRGDDFGAYELEALTGLRWLKKPRDTHQFTHVATGFSFQLSAREGDDDEPIGSDPIRPPKPGHEVAEEVSYVPLGEGSVSGLVPSFLADPMDFDTADMPIFTYKLLQALHTAASQRIGAAMQRA